MTGAERARMADAGHPEEGWNEASPWYQWGPYLSERAWGSVREDYSADGDAWNSFPHDHARSRAYRWNEDGMAGLSDVFGRLCLGLSLWNGVDPILKERMFGLTNQEGNHGEDVKDYWWYLDALPSGAWLRWRYHYPQAPFPYETLIEENARRSKFEPEYELLDTGVFDDDRYWIVEVHYAKADPTDILMRVVVRNQAPEEATLHVLPTLWFRNEWAVEPDIDKPTMLAAVDGRTDPGQARHPRRLHARGRERRRTARHPSLLFCENETNRPRIYDEPATTPYPEGRHQRPRGERRGDGQLESDRDEGRRLVRVDGPGRRIGRDPAPAPPDRGARVIDGQGRGDQRLERQAHRPAREAVRHADAPARVGGRRVLRGPAARGRDRRGTARHAPGLRRACSGASSTTATTWPAGSTATRVSRRRPPSATRRATAAWRHFDAADIMSMPDPWEYPWFAAWDLAFHAVTLAHIDPAFAKYQLLLLCREWFQHPNGALPAYEWSFDDVNPPVHAAAALLVWDIDGRGDIAFLKRIFHKLLMNFTWWLNRQDKEGNDLFGGGFLGLDNIGAFDRSHLPAGAELEQSDASAWMFQYCLSMLRIATVLSASRSRLRGHGDELPRACGPDHCGDEPERLVGRDRRVLLRRTQARRRLDRRRSRSIRWSGSSRSCRPRRSRPGRSTGVRASASASPRSSRACK